MSAEVEGVTGEGVAWITQAQEISVLLEQGFKGDIILHCPGDGSVRNYHLSEFRQFGERRVYDRRVAGPRAGEDRRKR